MFEVTFQYDEQMRKWEVIVKGASSELEALEGFNAVLLTCAQANVSMELNKATKLPDNTFKISVGVYE